MTTKKYPILADNKHCTGCMGCVDACHQGALTQTVNKEGHYTYKIDTTKCVGCLLCERICPVVGDKSYGDNSLNNPVYAAWSNNEQIRVNSSSGGVAAEISNYFLSKGGVVIGASLDETTCHHICITDVNYLFKLQGSKYVQSDTTGVYRQMLQYLKAGRRVLFTGTPCQVAAAINFVKDEKLKDYLYTLDIVCGGVPSLFLRDRFMSEYGDEIKELHSFRNKDNGWKATGYRYELKAITKQYSLKSYGLHNLLLGGFGMELTNRYSCYNCKFALVNRKSDFTVADFWGDTEHKEEHYKGLSTLSVHTNKGSNLLDEIKTITCIPTTWEKVLPGNYRYAYGKSIKGKTFARKLLSTFFSKMSYRYLCLLYAGAATPQNILFFFLKAIYVAIGVLNYKKAIHYINKEILSTSR